MTTSLNDTVKRSILTIDKSVRRLGLCLDMGHYVCDNARRLQTLTSPAGSFTYTYLCSGVLPLKVALPGGASIANTFDNVTRLTGTTLKNSRQATLNHHGYVNNVASQRTQQTRTDSSYVNCTYDKLSQLQSARGYTSGGTPIINEQLGYRYDAAWNLWQRT